MMKNKEPFQLTNLLVLYNAAMTLLNLYIFVEVSEKKLLNLLSLTLSSEVSKK